MRRSKLSLLLLSSLFVMAAAAASGCVKQSEYDALQAKYDESQLLLSQCNANLEGCRGEVFGLEERVADLEGTRDALAMQKGELEASVDEMQRAIAEYKRREDEARARIEEYRQLLAKFKEMVDAGKLKVKIRDGRMVVELASDVLFDSGSAKLSEQGKLAIQEVAAVLASIPDRKFQVEGHTDNQPIKTARSPSNWELSTDRALTVVHTMLEAGMPANRISAAGFGEALPVGDNETPQGRSSNRRIEIVLVPDLSQLPGFDELNRIGNES